jgi:hypothetical protein
MMSRERDRRSHGDGADKVSGIFRLAQDRSRSQWRSARTATPRARFPVEVPGGRPQRVWIGAWCTYVLTPGPVNAAAYTPNRRTCSLPSGQRPPYRSCRAPPPRWPGRGSGGSGRPREGVPSRSRFSSSYRSVGRHVAEPEPGRCAAPWRSRRPSSQRSWGQSPCSCPWLPPSPRSPRRARCSREPWSASVCSPCCHPLRPGGEHPPVAPVGEDPRPSRLPAPCSWPAGSAAPHSAGPAWEMPLSLPASPVRLRRRRAGRGPPGCSPPPAGSVLVPGEAGRRR